MVTSSKSSRRRKLVVVLTAAAIFIGASSIASTSASTLIVERKNEGRIGVEAKNLLLSPRHGDGDDDEDNHHHKEHKHKHQEMTMEMEHTSSTLVNLHEHSSHHHHHDDHHEHTYKPNPYDIVPDPLFHDKNIFMKIPSLPKGVAGGHSHGGHGEAKMDLNETKVLRSKGPDPLSYIEWDFAYGLGDSNDLLRFSSAQSRGLDDLSPLMGVSGNRWRSLLDEKDSLTRNSIAKDMYSRVKDTSAQRHPSLLILHVLGCIVSCFVLLPLALALRSADSTLAPLASLVYLLSLMTSLFMSQLYKAMTPQLYPSNSHSGLGYAIFCISLLVFGGDVFKVIRRIKTRSELSKLLQDVSFSSDQQGARVDEYDASEEERMLSEDRREDPDLYPGSHSSSSHRVHFATEQQHQQEDGRVSHQYDPMGTNSLRQHSRDLPSPTSTLCNTPRTSLLGEPLFPWKTSSSHKQEEGDSSEQERVGSWRQFDDVLYASKQIKKDRRSIKQIFKTVLRYTHVIVARSLPVLSFVASYTGLAVYTGSCRGPYRNVCMAHGIKGGIFFWYGLISFARYMGAYADIGWAWNRQPWSQRKGAKVSSIVTAEWVECFVIFFYGITNTWMERFGAKAGDPYTVKQVQHISIAIMFWFAGIMGMILETNSLKKLLALPVSLKQSNINANDVTTADEITYEEVVEIPTKPPSYNFSFNPFPALVIGITGVAMAAHHQDYIYQVAIHSLWGNLLAGFSIFRILTYFFLFLRPPTSSIIPSRPPTEALASFCLTAGGLVFMLSSEEVSFAAMRNGFGDIMMILNLTVAIVCFLFCGIAALMIIKAFAIKRERQIRQRNHPIHMEHIPSSHIGQEQQSQSIFVLQNEEEEESQADRNRMSSSPVTI